MGSFYQSLSYVKGGKRTRKVKQSKKSKKNTRQRGGFYPSIMGGVMRAGTYLLPLAFKHGSTLLNHKKKGSKKSKTMRKK